MDQAIPTGVSTGPTVVQLGTIRAVPLAVTLADEKAKAHETQAQPLVQGLAGYVRKCWEDARMAKQQTVEPRLLQSVRARRGEYDPEKLAQIKEMGGAEIYAMLTSVKCRAAGSWLRDVMLGTASERPWAIRPTPIPDLSPEVNESIVQKAAAPLMQAMQMGVEPTDAQVKELVASIRDQTLNELRDEARKRSERMADKMEDQLVEGGFLSALDDFLDDITTFPTAVLKGPVTRRKPRLTWKQDAGGYRPVVEDQLVLEWERVSPFNVFPSPGATNVNDGYLIERHRMSRSDLQALIGVKGYDDASIRAALDDYGRGGLRNWTTNDAAQASAEGKSQTAVQVNSDALIDALQFWGSVQGKWLIDWGLSEKEITDPVKEYEVEVWLIGSYVIRAVLNYDPLCRKPYYKASYEEVPGSWWGNSVADLVRDSQTVVNAAARAMVNNMSMASGPQVAINVDRLPAGEDISQLVPWKIWQVTSDPVSGAQMPVQFFQPQSNIQELMGVFEKFSQLADEYSGIPRYLSGDATGGAGRTASGLSMLINNASKSIKQVLSNIDMNVMMPLLTRLYEYNMQYSDDPELKGDINIVARGSSALVAKEAAQVRRNEFLAATANPIDSQIVGVQGRAAILRETAKGLDMDVDKIVPPEEVLMQKFAAMAQAQAAAAQAGTSADPTINGQQLQDGAPITDNFSPPAA